MQSQGRFFKHKIIVGLALAWRRLRPEEEFKVSFWKKLYRVPEILVEVLKDSSVPQVGHVDVALEGDAVAPDGLGDGLQISTNATLDLRTIK